MPRARRIVTSRPGGASAPPYASFNLGLHVGDDPTAVHANRSRLARATGLGADRLVWMEQVHGSAVAVVDGPRAQPVPQTDGLVTATPGLALMVLVADCVPVLLASPGAVGAVHAGRAGSAAGVVPAAVAALVGLGADLAATDALLGPSICGACYEVPAEMQASVEAALPGSATTTRRGAPGLDLRAVPQVVEDCRRFRVQADVPGPARTASLGSSSTHGAPPRTRSCSATAATA